MLVFYKNTLMDPKKFVQKPDCVFGSYLAARIFFD
jgi:hypothetical protein